MDVNDADFVFALQLQEQFNKESKNGFPLAAVSNQLTKTNTDHILALHLQDELNKEAKGPSSSALSHENVKTSVVDKFWELNDPNPDIHGLFLEFNASYFWNKLQGVEVRWSSRMTLCAGVCCYEGHGGLCSVRLSLPLLKLRPRKDLVETLLHEMIHAYLFVTRNNRDHDAHGPEFLKHMYRINKLTGANITIYHNFHDEVNEYRQHWWRCNGPCRRRPPYYGILRRAMNRAPSANDFWWEEHRMTCGGTYEKIKEPEGNNAKRKRTEILTGAGKKAKSENMDIKTFVTPSDENQPANSQPSFHNKINGKSNRVGPTFANKNLPNIHTLASPSIMLKTSQITPFTGKGQMLGSSPLQNINGVNKKHTLLSYFESSKNTPEKHSYLSIETEFGNKKGQYISPIKKQPGSTRGSYASPLSTVLPHNKEKKVNTSDFRTPKKIDEIWPKATNTSLHLKEGNSRKKFLPAGKLSTASPLNHVKKIFMASDNDDNNESLHNRTLPDIMASKLSMQKEQSASNDSSHEKSVMLNNANSDSASSALTNIVICPVCNQEIQDTHINNHLDLCLSS